MTEDQRITERLQELTLNGEINWKMFYNQHPGNSQMNMQQMSRPEGFIAEDPIHGFGRPTISMENMEHPEHGKPALYVQGNRVDADETDLYTLLDAVQAQIDERRAGGGMSIEDHIQERVEAELDPLREENERLRFERDRERERCDRMLAMLEDQRALIAHALEDADLEDDHTESNHPFGGMRVPQSPSMNNGANETNV